MATENAINIIKTERWHNYDEIKILTGFGVIYNYLGNYQQELEAYCKGRQFSQEVAARDQEAVTLTNTVMAHRSLENLAEALNSGQNSLQIARLTNTRH